ncbi:MAG: iron complex transport system ATP-binding protein [Frankiaceae bacterium]|nr:iron complex transport system ATP-binding protein [Frankiaceae bacterium]
MSDAVLELRDVRVVRGGATLLDDVDWTVRADERWVILGPNGAGKTTLLSLCSGSAFPTKGTVDVLGERLGRTDLRELKSRIGVTTSTLADRIPPDERVLDVVMTGAYAVVGRWREEYDDLDADRARYLLRYLGCEPFVDRAYSTLSEGERKRVQIARALMPDPELLLFDEPAAGLDLGAREALVLRLSRIASDPASPATVLVTHHVEEIPPGSTHVLLLRDGQVVESGPLDEALTGDSLSTTFQLPLVLAKHGARYTARTAFAAG